MTAKMATPSTGLRVAHDPALTATEFEGCIAVQRGEI
jgi:hypothetical protein